MIQTVQHATSIEYATVRNSVHVSLLEESRLDVHVLEWYILPVEDKVGQYEDTVRLNRQRNSYKKHVARLVNNLLALENKDEKNNLQERQYKKKMIN